MRTSAIVLAILACAPVALAQNGPAARPRHPCYLTRPRRPRQRICMPDRRSATSEVARASHDGLADGSRDGSTMAPYFEGISDWTGAAEGAVCVTTAHASLRRAGTPDRR